MPEREIPTAAAAAPEAAPTKPNCPVCAQFPIDDVVWVKILQKIEYAAMRRGEVLNLPEELAYKSEMREGRFHCKGCKLTLFDNEQRINEPGTNEWISFASPFSPACVVEKRKEDREDAARSTGGDAKAESTSLQCQRCACFVGGRSGSLYIVNSLCVQFIPLEAPPPKKYAVAKSEEEWRKLLSDTEYEVMRSAGTEPPDVNAFVDIFDKGHYECKACGNELFSSENKFRATCGWPAFNQPMRSTSCDYSYDYKKGFRREECLCHNCGSHLGHRFYDAHDQESGMRYCINSICLNFVPA